MGTVLRKKVGASVLVLMIMVYSMPAIAGAFAPGYGKPGKGFGRPDYHRPALGIWRNPQVIEKLQLTQDQVKNIRDLDFSHRENVLPLRSQIEANRLKMDKAISEDTVDPKTVLSLAEKIADLKGKIFVRNIESRLAVKEILTDDQTNELRRLFRKQKKRGPRSGRNCAPGGYTVEQHGHRLVLRPDNPPSGHR